ncbi:hypothetical protein ACN1C3_08630 [Pseudomonas sp. H11T01]|uniref:hypothetical protein n=1 Tax=Pseudomonas sp. H11T01 TaxID=3402749 RepID=UPI003AD79500
MANANRRGKNCLFTAETSFLSELILNSRAVDPQRLVRLPGQAGLKLREERLRDGLELSEAVVVDLNRTAEHLHLAPLAGQVSTTP